MDENRLPELPQEAFRPMIAQSVQLEQFLGEELIFCFRDLDGVHTFTVHVLFQPFFNPGRFALGQVAAHREWCVG